MALAAEAPTRTFRFSYPSVNRVNRRMNKGIRQGRKNGKSELFR